MRFALSVLLHAGALGVAWLCLVPEPAREEPRSMTVVAHFESTPEFELAEPPPEEPAPPAEPTEAPIAFEFPVEDVETTVEAVPAEYVPPSVPRVIRLERSLRPDPAPEPAPAPAEVARRKPAPVVARTVPVKTTPPRVVREESPRPRYPSRARRRGLEGRVVLRVAVSIAGRAEKVEVVESSGHGVLDRAAAAAVKQWVFTPARRGAQPVATTVRVPVEFKLRR